MSNSKAAEPAQVAPFLTHVVSHHGRLTLIPPENAGRVRKNSKVQAKKERKQVRGGERGGRSEDNEEPRFNLGIPKSTRSGSSRRKTARAPAPVRSREPEEGYGEDLDIPDYPPPSFQEATSSSVQLQMLSISSSTTASSTAPSSTTSSPTTSDCSPTRTMTPSQRMLSIVVEPSSSPASSPNPSPSSLSSSSPSKFTSESAGFTSQTNLPKSNFPLPPTPQSHTSDSDSDTSLDFVSLALEPSQHQWEEDRLLGLTLEERVEREKRRQRAAQSDAPQQADAQSPTQAEPSRCKSNQSLIPYRGRGKGRTTLQVPPHPSWRMTLDEPSLRTTPSTPLLAQASSKSLSPLSPLRPSSPTSVASRPYHSLAPASSSLSLSLGHLRLPGTFGKSTTSLGAFSSLSNGRDSSGSRRLFSKAKGKEKERAFSDGELDEREEEALDSWEVIDEEPVETEPGPSTSKPRPRLTLKPVLKPSEISVATYDEKVVQERVAGENDTRVDPFPISAEPSSPEMDRSSSISPTPTNFYPPNILPLNASSSFQPPTEIQDQADVVRRPRYGSIRNCHSPPPAAAQNRRVHSPPPPSPTVRTSSVRAISPHQTSPSRPSPLSGISIPSAVTPSMRSPMSVLTPTQLQPPLKTRTPPPLPPKTSPSLLKLNISRALEGHEVPLPPTPSEPDSVISNIGGWSKPAVQGVRETEREVGRLYGYPPGPHPFFTSFVPATYKQPPAQGDCQTRTRPVDYTHAPSVPSRLALSIPTYSQSPSIAPMSAVPSPMGSHYRGRPLPTTPDMSSPIMSSAVLSAPLMQEKGHCCCCETHDHTHRRRNVPEGSLIDFETDLNANTTGSSEGGTRRDMGRTTAAVENDGFSILSVSTARSTRSIGSFMPGNVAPRPAATSERPPFSNYTDLDLLASRLVEGDRNGSDYNALLLVQEFVGPAAHNQIPNINMPLPPAASALRGKIAIERRRVTKDGRVKLKMTLLGVVVDKCSICLSQFKDGESAALGIECQHACHEKCLRTWLAKSPTCPLCRVPLRINDSEDIS